MLNSRYPSASVQPAAWTQAWSSLTTVFNALGLELYDVVLALCGKYRLTVGQGLALLFFKLGIANQGACHVEDAGGNSIPLALNCVLISPVATGPILTQALAGQLTAIEVEVAPDAIGMQAMSKADVQLRAEQRRRLDAETKVATRKMVRLQALLAQRRELEACEPKEADYPDHLTEMIAWNQRKEGWEISIDQAELDGDPETARACRKALNALLATPPSSFEADHRRWSLKIAAVESQILLLQGANEEVAYLNAQKRALLAEDARAVEPATPKLGFLNVSMSAVYKAVTAQWPVATALYSGASTIKALVKQGAAMVESGSGQLLSAHAPGRVQLGIFAATTPEAFVRDMATAGQEGVVALANFLIVVDLPQQGWGVQQKPSAPDCLTVFDGQVRATGAASVRKMLSAEFEPQPITVSPEAAAIVEAEYSMFHGQRLGQWQHPVMDAFLMMRMRQTFYVIAGLLHLWRRQTGSLSVSTMQDAVFVGRFLIDQMGCTLDMAREVRPEEIDANALFHALRGYVAQQMEKGNEKAEPFAVKLSTLHSKAKSFGLTKARVDGALKMLLAWDWIKARQDGLDTVFDLDPHRFAHSGTSA